MEVRRFENFHPNNMGRKVMSVGAISLALVGGTAGKEVIDGFKAAGRTEVHQPVQSCVEQDETIRIGTYNAAEKLPAIIPKIQEMVKEEDIDILAIQEATPGSDKLLAESFPCYSVSSVLAHKHKEGKSNIILARGKAENVKSKVLAGSNPAKMIFNGLAASITNPSLRPSANEIVEPRAAIAVTVNQKIADQEIPIQFITGHIDRFKSVREKQLSRFMKHIDKRKSDNINTLVCGDFNSQPSQMLGEDGVFSKHGMFAERTKHTYAFSTSSVDYCAFTKDADIKLVNTMRHTKHKEDHYLVTSDVVPVSYNLPTGLYDKIVQALGLTKH